MVSVYRRESNCLSFIFLFCLMTIAMSQKVRCGHFAAKSYADAHGGLCRKCHSNFEAVIEIEKQFGEDALVEYWYGLILARIPDGKQEIACLISHLVDFYQQKLIETPSKANYIKKMLFMLHSVEDPFVEETLR